MKELFIGTVKGCFFMGTLIGAYWALNGFKALEQIDIVSVISVCAILEHYVDKEKIKK